MSSGDTLLSHRGGRTCGLPTLKGRAAISLRHPARFVARVAHSPKAGYIAAALALNRSAHRRL
jgi:hypothetical protein